MRFLFIMDPVSTIQVDADTSFALMLSAQSRGHEVYHCLAADVALEGRSGDDAATEVFARVAKATMSRTSSHPVTLAESDYLRLDSFDAIFIRKDPPFDSAYWWLTLQLEKLRSLPGGGPLVINDPAGLRTANEKLYACHFPSVTPRTIVTADKTRVRQFVEEVGGKAVIKPIDGHGGEGVFFLDRSDKNFKGIVEHVTRVGTQLAMVQAFLPAVVEGDKRILLIDGEIVGAILRIPQADDVRSNIHVGGSVAHAEITDADRQIIATVAPRLKKDGLYFVGLDVIGGRLTEVNVTSPTGIQQMSRFTGQACEDKVIAWAEKRAARG